MMLDEKKTIEGIARFFAEHGRWPSAASSSGYERSAGLWLNVQRVACNGGVMDPFRASFLDQHLPGWRASSEEIWQERAREASDFILANGRLPIFTAEAKGEQLIAIFLSNQRALKQGNHLPFARVAWLDAHCPGWLGAPASKSIRVGGPMFALKRRPS
ncbi:hypothetical protein [Arthrobacter sp. UYCo732]|uniref:hypothetical protein n=1 Tax=Arthrobacter sp. UYCo732 TaxID=3156336 RepID=UPI0033983121